MTTWPRPAMPRGFQPARPENAQACPRAIGEGPYQPPRHCRLHHFGLNHGEPQRGRLRQFADGFFQVLPGLIAIFALPFRIEARRAQLVPEWRDRGLVEASPLAARSSRTVALSFSVSPRSSKAAALMFLATMARTSSGNFSQARRLARNQKPSHVVGQRTILLHLVELCRRDQGQRIFLTFDDPGLQRRIDFAEIDRGRRGVERLEHRGPQRRNRHPDLEAFIVLRAVDRLG